MTIITDNREKQSPVPQMLENLGLPIHYATLDVGDYLIGDVCVERKDTNDYIQSLLSGHLTQQLYNMSTQYSISYLIIEGYISQALAERNISRNVYLSSIAGGTIKRSPEGKSGIINYIMLETDFDTALFLKFLHEKIERNEPRLPIILKQNVSDVDRLIYILCSIPDIGPTRGKKLLEKFGTITGVCNVSATDLEKVLGPKSALNVFLWLHKVYEEKKE